MSDKRNIVLFGFMGTGKTSVGMALASKLGMEFVDMDSIIEVRQKKSISKIFSEKGEPYFRRLERELVQELSAKKGLIIATGGGVVLDKENISDYGKTGTNICLTAKPEVIMKRVEADTARPLLKGDDRMQKIKKILADRKELYASVQNQIDTSDLSVEQVVENIIKIADQ